MTRNIVAVHKLLGTVDVLAELLNQTLKHLFFTYIIPVIPFFFAWDGAVSNARTYTLDDWDELLKDLDSANYKWEKGVIDGKAKMLYLLRLPLN